MLSFNDYTKLENRDSFLQLLDQSIHASISEQQSLETTYDSTKINFSDFYKKILPTIFHQNTENVFKFCQSPIEKIFLNSLMLLFIRNRMPCLYITPPFSNAEIELEKIRCHHKLIAKFIKNYKIHTNDHTLDSFEERLIEKVNAGKLKQEFMDDVLNYEYIGQHFDINSYHITPQASFPNLLVDNKTIRVDMLIWVPNDPEVRIIVECDGFKYHSNKTSFINDKIRDRILQQNGYRVLRYSGSEIFNTPIKVSADLFNLIDTLDSNKNGKRIL